MNERNSHDDWTTCPPGTFDRVRQQLPAESTQRTIKPYATGLALAAVAAVMLFGFTLLRDNGENKVIAPPRSMLCGECLPLIQDYVDNKVDKVTRARMEEHLSYCVICTDRYEEITGRPFSAPTAYRHEKGQTTIATMFLHRGLPVAR